jgi:hypothetical protein
MSEGKKIPKEYNPRFHAIQAYHPNTLDIQEIPTMGLTIFKSKA